MQNKQDRLGRPRKCLNPLRATWKLCRQSRGDTSRCCIGLWGPALTGDIQWLNELAHIESTASIFSQAVFCVGVWIRAGFHRLELGFFISIQDKWRWLKARGVLLSLHWRAELRLFWHWRMGNVKHMKWFCSFSRAHFKLFFTVMVRKFQTFLPGRHLKDNIFSFLLPQRAPLSIPLWDWVVSKPDNQPPTLFTFTYLYVQRTSVT